MDVKEYFRLMRETSDVIDTIILDTIRERIPEGSLRDLILDLPLKRANSGKPKSRPAMFRWAYESCGGSDWRTYKNVGAALEMLNLSTYVLNYVLDDKGGEKPKQQRNNECMSAMILRELAQSLLLSCRQRLPPKDLSSIDDRLSEINLFTSGYGQYLDGNLLRTVDENYLETYLRRCEGLTGKFMQNAVEIGALCTDAPPEWIRSLGEFGRHYGIVVQMMNDLGDYLPQKTGKHSVGRVHQDQFSDLKHGCITYPAYLVLKNGSSDECASIERVRGNLTASEDDCLAITKAFIRVDGVQEMKRLALIHTREAKKHLHTLPQSIARDCLSTALRIARSNKFYEALRGFSDE